MKDEYSSLGLSHGEKVEIFARRNNPYAQYHRVQLKDLKNDCESILESIQNGEKFDYLLFCNDREFKLIYSALKGTELKKRLINNANSYSVTKYYLKEAAMLDEIAKKGKIRVLSCASNCEQDRFGAIKPYREYFSSNLLSSRVEGVGALDVKGKVAEFSASRNSIFTQHYEYGVFNPKIISDKNGNTIGINITGLHGCDAVFDSSIRNIPSSLYGTSFSAPIRVAKLALNDMMQGIL